MFDFKKMVEYDILNVFLNTEEFGEELTVEGKIITGVLDAEYLSANKSVGNTGIQEATELLYANVKDLPARLTHGSSLEINNIDYIVIENRVDMGMATVLLKRNQGR